MFTLGFCMGGRMSFLAATLGLPLAGVMGMYGTLSGAWRNDAPAPLDVVLQFGFSWASPTLRAATDTPLTAACWSRAVASA